LIRPARALWSTSPAARGADAIAFCRWKPELQATILDFPTVTDVARGYVEAAGMSERIGLLAGDAREVDWPTEQDAVFVSYLLSAVAGLDIPRLLASAHAALRPGGRLIVHDFMLDETRSGPSSAALFFTCQWR
jgi:ubiquinone/menaquinone biosynthesis C-methylase UbiE